MNNGARSGLVFLGLGFELLAMFFVGAFIGKEIDKHFGWNGLGFLGMIFILLIAWVMHFIFLLKKYMKSTNGPDSKA